MNRRNYERAFYLLTGAGYPMVWGFKDPQGRWYIKIDTTDERFTSVAQVRAYIKANR